MFRLQSTRRITVSSDLVKLFIIIIAIFLIYFFSYQLQKSLAKFLKFIGEKIGTYSVGKDFYLQRYTYQHSRSPIT